MRGACNGCQRACGWHMFNMIIKTPLLDSFISLTVCAERVTEWYLFQA